MTDDVLVAAVARADEAAFATLYDQYARPVFSLAAHIVQDRGLAEEITQEVFLRLWRQAASYRVERGRVASWLLGITHNVAIDQLRRQKCRPVLVSTATDAMHDARDTRADVDEVAWLTVQRELIRQALGQLPAPQRRVIELAYFGGLTHAEIAALLGDPLGTIKTRLRLGIARLRLLLGARAAGLRA